jgi:CHAT domain-containing protein
VATTLNNLGNVLRDSNKKAAARAYEGALQIYRELAAVQPEVYRAAVATTLNNLGTVLGKSNEKAAARTAYEEALQIYRELAVVQPGVYRADVATTLNNLGNVLGDLNEKAAARAAYREAEQLFLTAGEQVALAILYANLAELEAEESGQFCTLAIELSEQAVRRVEDLLKGLQPLEHSARSSFKRVVERAYQRLILFHASGLPESDRHRLPRFFEALRQVELLAEAGTSSADGWEAALQEIARGAGPLAMWMDQRKAVFVWAQVAQDRMVFAIQRTGKPLVVEIGDSDSLAAFRIAAKAMEEHVQFVQNKRPKERVRQLEAKELDGLADQCHQFLPIEVQRLLEGGESETIVLAPCGESAGFCWELMRMGERYLGLEKVVARVHGLTELAQVYGRRAGSRKAVVVGNPLHEKCEALPAAGASVQALARDLAGWELTRSIWTPANQEGTEFTAVGERATSGRMREWLGQQDLGLFVFSGHGGRLALGLEGKDVLTDGQVREMKLTAGPLVHLDCCLAGFNIGTGGGKFVGMPVTLLQCGASVVVASAHPLYDGHAAFLAQALYNRLLDADHAMCTGKALLAARRETQKAFGNPVHWATTVLWGNPAVRLPVAD